MQADSYISGYSRYAIDINRVYWELKGGKVPHMIKEVAMITTEQLQQLRNKPLIKVNEAAEIPDVTPRMVRNLLHSGEVKGTRIGRAWRVDTRSWLEYLNLA